MAHPVGSASHFRSLYRSVLRELPSRPLQTRSPLHHSIRASFAAAMESSSSSSSSSSSASPNHQLKAQEIEQFVGYIKAQRMYAMLLERYNPGMTMDEEERIRLTARRVGMEMPVEWYNGQKA